MSSSSSYNNLSVTTLTESSGSANSNKSPRAKAMRNALRKQFEEAGMHERHWQPGWHKQDQIIRRAERALKVLNYPYEYSRPRPVPTAKSLVSREITGKLPRLFKIGNLAVRIRHANGSREFYKVADFNKKYGHKWRSLPSGSSRLIAENSNIQRRNVRVVRFV